MSIAFFLSVLNAGRGLAAFSLFLEKELFLGLLEKNTKKSF